MPRPQFTLKTLLWLMAVVACASVLWTEVGGFPNLYGWPLLVLRPGGGHDPPRVWVWVVDIVAAGAAIYATWCVASSYCRVSTKGFQFRLATLLGVVAALAVIAALWRWSADHRGYNLFSERQEKGTIPAFSIWLDPTASMVWLPLWIRPMQLAVRLAVLFGLGCTIYSLGRLIARFVWLMKDTGRRATTQNHSPH